MDPAVDPVSIGPVGLDCDRAESLLLDEALRDERALPVELVRAVRGLADQDELRVPDQLQQPVVIARRTGEWQRRILAARGGPIIGRRY
jgi:hypothetical protein